MRRPGVPLVLLVLGAGIGAGCRTPDPDGLLATAQELPYDHTLVDSVWCERSCWRWWSKEDCADWYRIRSSRPEQIEVSVVPRDAALADRLDLVLTDGDGRNLQSADHGSPGTLSLRWSPEDPRYYVVVRPRQDLRKRADYQIRASQEEPPPPPPPKHTEVHCEKERRRLLEVEDARSGERTVVLDQPAGAPVHPVGTRGRLVEGDAVVAEFEVTEVYPDGSRARVAGGAGRTISPQTEAEFESCVEVQR